VPPASLTAEGPLSFLLTLLPSILPYLQLFSFPFVIKMSLPRIPSTINPFPVFLSYLLSPFLSSLSFLPSFICPSLIPPPPILPSFPFYLPVHSSFLLPVRSSFLSVPVPRVWTPVRRPTELAPARELLPGEHSLPFIPALPSYPTFYSFPPSVSHLLSLPSLLNPPSCALTESM
jgi:hypothetical protein